MKNPEPREPRDTTLQGAVCVIDGDQGIRNSLLMLLGTMGVTVVAFERAEDLLTGLTGPWPALLITELALPGMGGFELKEALDARHVSTPVLGMTEDVTPGSRERAARLGFVELVEKPFVSRSVLRWVQAVLGLPE